MRKLQPIHKSWFDVDGDGATARVADFKTGSYKSGHNSHKTKLLWLLPLFALSALLGAGKMARMPSVSADGEAGDGTTVVAKIGETEYTDLASALSGAGDGDTIELVADAPLTATQTVTGKAITITAADAYKITGASSMVTMIKVETGAGLTLSGRTVIDGTGMKQNASGKANGAIDGYGVLDVAGTLTMTGEAAVENCTIGWASGVINVHGEGATFNLQGGSIQNNKADFTNSSNTNTYGGTVRLYTGATMNMTGGAIKNNQVNGYIKTDNDGNLTDWSLNGLHQSAGIFANGENVTVNISGGQITGNTAPRGSAIYVYGMISAPVVNISGDAMISDNSYGEYAYYEGNNGTINQTTGAVYVEYQGTVNMSGGTISNNKGFSGGGVTLLSYWLGSDEYVSAEFNMTGGTISENSAYSGGGIYSYSNGANITGGSIINNTAENLGGGIYSEGNATAYGRVYLYNVIVTRNTAWLEGGGIWLCPTGELDTYITNGGAFYDNTAEYDADADYFYDGTALNGGAAGDDVASGASGEHTLTLASRILGGGAIYYYTDGGLDAATALWPDAWKTDSNPYWDATAGTSAWPYPVVDPTVARYGENEDTEPKTVDHSNTPWSLKSAAEGTALAESLASVLIAGNTAAYGGGIGANGGVEIGEDNELMEISVEKVWVDAGIEHPDSVTIWLTNTINGVTYDVESAVLSAENDWRHTFEYLPISDAYSYYVTEESMANYTFEVTGDAESGFTVTNTYVEPDKPGEPADSGEPTGTVSPDTGDLNILPVLAVLSLAGTALGASFAVCRRG